MPQTPDGSVSAGAAIEFPSLGGSSFSGCPITTVNIGPGVTGIYGVDNIPKDKLSLQAKAALNRLRGDR